MVLYAFLSPFMPSSNLLIADLCPLIRMSVYLSAMSRIPVTNCTNNKVVWLVTFILVSKNLVSSSMKLGPVLNIWRNKTDFAKRAICQIFHFSELLRTMWKRLGVLQTVWPLFPVSAIWLQELVQCALPVPCRRRGSYESIEPSWSDVCRK